MSKPGFQAEWEEIDEEYQQLQVTENLNEYSIICARLVGVECRRGHAGFCSSLSSSFLFAIHSQVIRKPSIEPISGLLAAVSEGCNIFAVRFIMFLTLL